MKNSIKIVIFIYLVVILGLSACNDAEYNPLGIHAFVAESTSGKSSKVTITNLGAEAVVTACLTETSSKDVKLNFVVDVTVLDKYNEDESTGFLVLPESAYEMDIEIIIPAGKFSANSTKIHIKPLSSELVGESYALPLRLVSLDNSVPTTTTTATYIIITESIITSTLPMFTGASGLVAAGFTEESPKLFPQFTVESRFQVSNTSNRNRDIFTNGGSILMRFEDPQNNIPNHVAHSMVQFQGDGWFLNPTISFKSNVWQHSALTYDGKTATLYVNGAFAGSKEGFAAPEFSSVTWFGGGGGHGENSSQWWSGCKILMAEARIWSVTRTPAQIQNNMTTINAKSKGLEAYWKFNDGEGNTFEDYTGNGHTLTTTKMPVWIPGIKSNAEATDWPK